ncbi:phage tail domain-containing protein [Hathewaya histolytica]|uniref:Tail component family protein n=1 Tax=Hathewaya histolytica TaxID=1498 RepID=A0A4U9RB94_HATHI|nr:phage tail domain-containing protein [Hathewaya histolytica]VTQ88789.1 tail component family protein [Hathewaya histolytica]
MFVNNIDIKKFGVELLEKKIGTAETIINNEWLKGACKPLILDKEHRYTTIQCIFVIKGDTRQDLEEKLSHFVKIIEECTVKFDDIEFYYDVFIQSKQNDYIGKNTSDDMEVQAIDVTFLSGHKYKTEITETMDHVTSKTINVPGNTETPAVITITVPIDTIDLTIKGLGEGIKVKNLKANVPVIINSEEGTVLEKGLNKFNDTEFWEFPKLKPGVNTISTDKVNSKIEIKYKPRWI